MPKKMTFDEWKAKAQKVAIKLGCPDDLWAADDPYDLKDLAKSDFESGFTPESFVREVFGEDIASRQNDEEMAREALEAGEV